MRIDPPTNDRQTEIVNNISNLLLQIKKENGFQNDLKSVRFSEIDASLDKEYKGNYPFSQIIDFSSRFSYEGQSIINTWRLGIELYLKKSGNKTSQELQWRLQNDVKSCIKSNPKLDLDYVRQMRLIDGATDLGLSKTDDSYSVIGIEVEYREERRC